MAFRPLAIAVYCGSSLGANQAYADCALSVGRALAASKRTLVYGGGSGGLMGVTAGAAIQSGGRVIGVRPFQMVGGEREKTTPAQQREEVTQALAAAKEKGDRVETVRTVRDHSITSAVTYCDRWL
jgi:predicted Rossmann-fold nucleotide-binding protein